MVALGALGGTALGILFEPSTIKALIGSICGAFLMGLPQHTKH